MDTRPDIQELQISLIKKASVAKRISILQSLSETVILLSRRAIARANPDLIAAIEPVVITLDRLKVAYYIAGGVASSAFGMARATMDIDIVSNLRPRNVDPFVEALNKVYYVDEEMMPYGDGKAAEKIVETLLSLS